jgi:alkylation response protein AidB-like acyl-CoA dehydrogenase
MLNMGTRAFNDETRSLFREQVRKFFQKRLVPQLDKWERDRIVGKDFWRECGEAGLLCPTVPEEYGGLGLDFSFNAIVTEELSYAGSSASLPLQSDIIADYLVEFGSEKQKKLYLPKMVSGEWIAAIAMTEPDAGSDLKNIKTTARREADHYVVNGSKTFISSGQNADFVIVAAKTDPAKGAKGISLVIVPTDTVGFRRGRQHDKIGQHSADTSELFFEDARVPVANCLGVENNGFVNIMKLLPQERLSQAIMGQAGAQRAFDEAVAYTSERKAFEQRLIDFQNTRFVLADIKAKLQVGWAHLDWCIGRHVEGRLTAEEASAAKLWHTEIQWKIVDVALQLHGGAGYMNESAIARLWRDARVQRIYGGTSEILKEVIGRSLGSGARRIR